MSVSVLLGILATVAFVLSTTFVRRRYFSTLSNIPGPFVASFSASLWHLWHIFTGHVEEAVIEQHQKHGTFVRIGHNEISICDPAAIRQVLMSHMDKGPTYAIFSMPDKRYVNQMAEVRCSEHMRKAKNLAAGYSLTNVVKTEPFIDGALQTLRTQLETSGSSKLPVKFEQWFNYLAFDVLGEATFSQSFGFLATGQDIGDTVANNIFLRLYISILGHFPWAHDYLLANPLIEYFNLTPSMHVFDTCMAAIKSRSQNPEVRKDMLEQWKDQLAKYPNRMDEIEILTNAVGNLGAGSDTVSSVLQGFVYYMISDPEMLSMLRKELDEANLADIPTFAETQNLPILQACIKESLRVHPPVGFGLTRIAPTEGVTICSRHFAAGTILSVNIWAMHQLKSLFGEDAAVFNPRRWLDPSQASKMNSVMIAFGAGYNQCPGQNLAKLELYKTCAMLMRDFDIRMVDPEKGWKYETYFTVAPHDWPCYVRRRKV
ncbi:related to cytochrome P450 oxidoreductase [Rhynchosporium graminicola]|uniref:Related to cytochrome P450 oxidoreductase n=1 Tax=Rhynchosporium graminicola TaxID=2792576 RepID=A0A1E1KFC2_9HELO|nr:related to cytochrome P450 oxidoreductase [Rhynchosporium commune]